MKEIDLKDPPGASGGRAPDDGGCFPHFPLPIDYPPGPVRTVPEPTPIPGDPFSSNQSK